MAPRKRPIKVGLIGCNMRALWYGAIFDDIDTDAYSVLDPAPYHHLTSYYKNDGGLDQKRATGFRLVKVYDRDGRAAARTAAAFRTKPEVCEDLDQVSKGVDLVFVANESGDGSDHLQLARPGLTKGVPTFVDRPFAATVKDAKAMIALARRKRAPLFSCSHMSMLPHAAQFKARFAELNTVEVGSVQGHGPNPAHVADGIELALFLFGDGFRGRVDSVQSMGAWPLEIMHVRYTKARQRLLVTGVRANCTREVVVVNSHTSATRNAFWATAISFIKPIDSPDLDAFVQPVGGLAVMDAIKKMVETGKPPLTYPQMIEPVAVAEAGRKAHNKPRPVRLKTLR